LRDPTAKGIRRANYTTGDGTISILKPESEWVQIACPSLVSEEVWEVCNRILDDQESQKIPMSKKTVHLLAGFVMCTCGNKMYVFNEAPVYKCKKCRRKIDVSDIDEIYHEQLKSFLLSDSDLSSVEKKSQQNIDDKEGLLKQRHTELSKLKKRLAEMIDLRLDGELSKDRFKELYTPLEEQMQQIETGLPELEAEVDFLKIQYLSAGTVLQEAKDLYNNWNKLPFAERRSIVETITQGIVVDTDTINISLSYLPTPPPLFQNAGNGEHKEAVFYMH
jgi:site-specific DNA recombinase